MTQAIGAASKESSQSGGSSYATSGADRTKVTLAGFAAAVPLQFGLGSNRFRNLNMKFVLIDSAASQLPLIKRGDIAAVDSVSAPPILVATDKGIGVKIVWADSVTPLSVIATSSIANAEGLRGKKIGTTIGTGSDFALDKYLIASGLSPATDVQKIDMPSSAMLAAFKTGQVDAVATFPPFTQAVTGAGGHILSSTPDLGLLIVGTNFIAKHRATVQTLVCDYAATHKAFFANPTKARAIIAKRIGISAADVGALLPNSAVAPVNQLSAKYLGGGKIAPTYATEMVKTGQLMASAGQLSKAPAFGTIRGLFDSSFARAVTKGACSK